jgi:hypothetical protein
MESLVLRDDGRGILYYFVDDLRQPRVVETYWKFIGHGLWGQQ